MQTDCKIGNQSVHGAVSTIMCESAIRSARRELTVLSLSLEIYLRASLVYDLINALRAYVN